ncbi:hypothetical protein Q9Q95_03360 [Sphingomonas sp. DG1-23]|jgi:hypothetical protein|uniref:hypothetical protein n=1 Tax=Sphingomonas sp. DG1-23 TaxID=3068316 RepID=UPI00273D02BE|nr:hypothetical protein [Sphingomonas sp. DG1-23]MDP5277950.1 hypothetical protein [Sphingomonas sp. DG1-23]
MASFTTNFADILQERAPDLAAAGTPEGVKTIVKDAEREAIHRTTIPDTFVYQATVVVLGISVLAVIVAQLWLALEKSQAEIPDGLIAIGSAAIGALAGLLAPTPAK